MKKTFLFLIIVLLSTICFAQEKISILDICYYDKNMNEICTHEQDAVIKNLQKKGFKIIKTEYEDGEGAGGYTMTFKYVTMRQTKFATTSTIGPEGTYSIEFKTNSEAREFAANAVRTGFFTKEEDNWYKTTREPIFGISDFKIKCNVIEFILSVP